MKLLIKNKFVSTCLGVLAVYFGIGFILPLSTFSVYITSYIHYEHEYVTMHYGYFINLIYSFASTASTSLAGYLENLIGFFNTIIVGFAIVFLTNLGFIFQKNIWLCYTLTAIFGFGTGIATSLLGKNLAFYLPNKKGLISGVLGFGVIIIAAIYSLSGEKIINFEGDTLTEEQHYYKEDVANNTYKYFILGIFLIPIGLILSLLLIYEYKPEENASEKQKESIENRISPGEKETKNDEENDKNKEKNKEEKKEESDEEKKLKMKISKQKLKQAIKTSRYWRIILISFFLNISVSFMITTGRTFGALIGINGTALQFCGVLQTLAAIIVGTILGILVDKKGALFILRITSIIGILPSLFLAFFMIYTPVFISCFVIYILVLVGLMVSFGPFLMEVFGIQESVLLGGVISAFSKISSVITTVSPFAFSLKCGEDKGCLKTRYKAMYLISSVCCGISCLLLFFEKSDKFNYDIISDENILLDKNKDDKKNELIPINDE